MSTSMDMKVGLWAYGMVQTLKSCIHNFFVDERGDTNFISLFIVLAVVVVLGVMFKDNVTGLVTKLWDSISTKTDTFTS